MTDAPAKVTRIRAIGLAAACGLATGCGGQVVTLVPVPDEANRVEVLTTAPDWLSQVARLAACVLRVDRASDCVGDNRPSVCDTRSEAAAEQAVQPIVDSLPRVRLTFPLAMNRQLRELFPSATPSTEVMDARRHRPCADWTEGACAAIRTRELAFVFEGTPGQPPARIQIFRVSPACRQAEPNGE